LLDTLLPRLRLEVPAGAPLAPETLFSFPPREIWMEVGFGAGEHLAAQAGAHPDVDFIGSEVFLNGIASTLRHIAERNLENVRIFDGDVRHLLPALPAGCLSRFFLMFPDPWPKSRHAKRRFISGTMLDEIARLLRPGGTLRVASDHTGYVRWTLLHATAHPQFAWQARGPEDWRVRPADGFPTRYEEKASAAGRPLAYLDFRRSEPLEAQKRL
jgi:tRNA (guanine-N7-)-methyltransferase